MIFILVKKISDEQKCKSSVTNLDILCEPHLHDNIADFLIYYFNL